MSAERPQAAFRPLDNGSKTQMGYNLEAAHWTKAFKSAQANYINPVTSFFSALGVIGALISLVVNAVVMLFLILGVFFGWLERACRNTPAEERRLARIKAAKLGLCDGTNGYWTHTDGINRPYPQDPEEVDPNWMNKTYF